MKQSNLGLWLAIGHNSDRAETKGSHNSLELELSSIPYPLHRRSERGSEDGDHRTEGTRHLEAQSKAFGAIKEGSGTFPARELLQVWAALYK